IALRNGGFVWYDVTDVEKARERPLAEVKDEVIKAWTEDQQVQALAKKAAELVKKIESGTPIADGAKEEKREVVRAEAVTPASTPPGLPPAAVNPIFAVKVDGAGYALGGDGASRIVFKVKSASVPATTPGETSALAPRLRSVLAADMMGAYVQKLE